MIYADRTRTLAGKGRNLESPKEISNTLSGVPKDNLLIQVGNIFSSEASDGRVYDPSGLSPSLRGFSFGWSKPKITEKSRISRLTPIECERLQGFPDGWTNFFEGCLDEILVYNRSISSVEVSYNYQHAFQAPYSTNGLVLWLRCNEGTATIASDSSGCDNNATLLNGVTWLKEVWDAPEWNPDLYVSPYGLINQYLMVGDIMGLLFAIWYSLIGEMIWAVVGFIVFFPMYRRTESVIYPCLILGIIGTSTIGLSSVLPFAALRIHYIFTMIGGAAILYKVFGERD